ncbi:MAG: InlB B-repeat-containing protein [Spirochaetales bacterium]|nr:InlB B-repeat-containing protein [Spirochaetales bacterium]
MKQNMFFKTMFVIICAAFIGCQTETTGSNEPPEDVTETAYYHIIFHYNITDQSVDIAVPTTENFAVPDCTDDRIGFEMPDGRPFVEWNISPYGTETSYKAGDLFNKQKKGTVTTLYAIWKDADNEPYDVEYDPNGGLGEMKRSTLFIDRSKRLPKCTFKAPTGKRFDCWNTKSDGLGKSYKDEETVTNLTAKGKTITLYAQWNNKEYYIVRFSDEQLDTQTDDLTFDNAKAVKPLPTLTKPGYAFGG